MKPTTPSPNVKQPDPKRRPTSFTLEDAPAASNPALPRSPRSFSGNVTISADDDPFSNLDDEAEITVAQPRSRRRFSFLNLAFAAFGTFMSLAFGLWADEVVRDLFSRSDWLGYAALLTLFLGLLAVCVIVGREIHGLMRLSAVQSLKEEAIEAANSASPQAGRKIAGRLAQIVSHRPETARGRTALEQTEGDVIDSPQMIELAERELLSPLDRKARALILGSAKRVSIVTAVSPRAIVDLAYVVFETARMVRSMAELYGGRPGKLGLARLMRDVVAHLAVTGSIAVGDGLAQQVLGQGLASKLSKRLGEGVINGLLTARIGIAAMDLCRPLPFNALQRPGIGDFMGDIISTDKNRDPG